MAADDHEPTEPERSEGPTPNGGAYALAYSRPDGSMEIVECDADGREIRRTYSRPRNLRNPRDRFDE